MKTNAVYIVVLGIVALGSVVAVVFAGDRGIDNSISGLVAIGAAAVGALATLARDSNHSAENEIVVPTYPYSPPPAHGWPSQQPRDWPVPDAPAEKVTERVVPEGD